MRSLFSRSPRLGVVAGLGIALAIPALALAAVNPERLATQTALTTETHDQGGRTTASLSIAVTGADSLPASGAVAINDFGKPLGGIVLDAKGRATTTLSLLPGPHSLSAVYNGDTAHQASASPVAAVQAQSSSTPDFGISVAPASVPPVTAGQSGSATVTITPINAAALSGPMFVTLSCSGLPDASACTFTPENIEIPVGAVAPITSSMVISTQGASLAKAVPPVSSHSRPAVLAVLLPGALVLVGMAFSACRRRMLSRFVLLTLVGFVAVLGATACNPLYYYKNHGPPSNLPTPSGTYTLSITAQSSNGITATTHSTPLVFTVK